MNIHGCRNFLIFLAFIFYSIAALAQDYSQISDSLEIILTEDSKIENEISALRAINSDSYLINKQFELLKNRNESHKRFVEQLLENYGWPPPDSISKEASIGLFVVIQHSGPDFMKAIFPKVEDAKRKGYISLQDYAMIVDRVRVFSNDYQLYGTQAKGIGGDKLRFFPILKEHKVDKRRKKMGLPPLVEYAKVLNVNYYNPARKYKKTLDCLIGIIHDENNVPLSGVKLYDGRKKYLTHTDEDGFFTIFFKKKRVRHAFIYEKDGYYRNAFILRDFESKVHDISVTIYSLPESPR